MKAVAVPSFKAIPQLMDLPEPPVKEGHIRIRLAAAGLNSFDWKMVDGILKDQIPVDRKVSQAQAPAAIAESRELKSKGKTIIVINDQL